MSNHVLITGHTLVIRGDILPGLEEPMACPGTEVGGQKTENKQNKYQMVVRCSERIKIGCFDRKVALLGFLRKTSLGR